MTLFDSNLKNNTSESPNIPEILTAAESLFKNKEFEDSVILFRYVSKNAPNQKWCALAWVGLGKCHREMGRFDLALTSFEKSFSIHKRPYVAVLILECLEKIGLSPMIPKKAIDYATLFSNQDEWVQKFKEIYLKTSI